MNVINEDFIAELVEGVITGTDNSDSVRERLDEDELELFNKLIGDKDMAAKKKITAKKVASKKVTTKKKVVKKIEKKDAVKKVEEKPESKMDIASRIFKKEYPTMKRKDILQLFMSQAGLTTAGASTYFQKLKKAHEDG